MSKKILITAILFACIITGAPIIIGLAIRGQNAEWIGFWANVAGGILSGGMTLIAALVAWDAVRTQITSNEKLHRLPAEEAYDAICKELNEYCRWIDEIWRACDGVLDASIDKAADRVSAAITAFGIGSVYKTDIIEEFLPALQPRRRLQAKRVISIMKSIEDQRLELRTPADQARDALRVKIMRDQFTVFERQLREFAPNLADIFNDRVKIQRTEWTLTDLLRSFLDQHLGKID